MVEYFQKKYSGESVSRILGDGEDMSDEITQQGLLPGVKWVAVRCIVLSQMSAIELISLCWTDIQQTLFRVMHDQFMNTLKHVLLSEFHGLIAQGASCLYNPVDSVQCFLHIINHLQVSWNSLILCFFFLFSAYFAPSGVRILFSCCQTRQMPGVL